MEQFKAKVCGCKSNVPELITIFSTPLPLYCVFHWWNTRGCRTACRLTHGAWPPWASRYRTSLLLVAMSMKDYRHQQSQEKRVGSRKEPGKEPTQTHRYTLHRPQALFDPWELLKIHQCFPYCPQNTISKKKHLKSSYFIMKNQKHIFLKVENLLFLFSPLYFPHFFMMKRRKNKTGMFSKYSVFFLFFYLSWIRKHKLTTDCFLHHSPFNDFPLSSLFFCEKKTKPKKAPHLEHKSFCIVLEKFLIAF